MGSTRNREISDRSGGIEIWKAWRDLEGEVGFDTLPQRVLWCQGFRGLKVRLD
jgi:hypothetical protein